MPLLPCQAGRQITVRAGDLDLLPAYPTWTHCEPYLLPQTLTYPLLLGG